MLPWEGEGCCGFSLGSQYAVYSHESLCFENNHEVHRAEMKPKELQLDGGGRMSA